MRAFEVMAITAGVGNGWQFGAEMLAASVGVWEGCEVYIDHGPPGQPRSVRDLAGVCGPGRYDKEAQGVRVWVWPLGPAGPVLAGLGVEWLGRGRGAPRVGFSADLQFTARGREVTQIVRVFSLDLVVHPARGGAFLRVEETDLDLIQGEHMSETHEVVDGLTQRAQLRLPAEGENLDELRQAYSAALLEARLSAARLPEAAAGLVRTKFAGRGFEPAELEAELARVRELAAALNPPAVGGPARRVELGWSGEERLQAAVDDLLGAPREAKMQQASVERLTGIRELYLLLTGDAGLTGRYDPQRAQLATTASLPALVKNTLNKVIVQEWEELGRAGYAWWQKVVSVQHFDSLNEISGVLVGEVSALPSVAEDAAYPTLELADSQETGQWTKYGGILPLTLELIDRDETHRLRQMPKKLAAAALRRISALVGAVFTQNGGVGPVMADGYNVFEATQHHNVGTTALSGAAWENACQQVYGQPLLATGGGAPRLGLDPRYLIVPRGLRLTAARILYPAFEREANIFSENMQRGEAGDVVVSPEFGDAADWAAVADPRIAPGVIVGERFGLRPEIFIAGDEHSPAMFTNDQVRLKVRHFVSVFVADYRPLFKANVV